MMLCSTVASHGDQVKGLRHLVLVSASPSASLTFRNVFMWTKSLLPHPGCRSEHLNLKLTLLSFTYVFKSFVRSGETVAPSSKCFDVNLCMLITAVLLQRLLLFGGCTENEDPENRSADTLHARVNPNHPREHLHSTHKAGQLWVQFNKAPTRWTLVKFGGH